MREIPLISRHPRVSNYAPPVMLLALRASIHVHARAHTHGRVDGSHAITPRTLSSGIEVAATRECRVELLLSLDSIRFQ